MQQTANTEMQSCWRTYKSALLDLWLENLMHPSTLASHGAESNYHINYNTTLGYGMTIPYLGY